LLRMQDPVPTPLDTNLFVKFPDSVKCRCYFACWALLHNSPAAYAHAENQTLCATRHLDSLLTGSHVRACVHIASSLLAHPRCRHQAHAVPEPSARKRRCTSQPAPPAPPAPAQTPLNLTELPVPAALASVFGVRVTQAQPPEGGVSFAYRGRTWWCARRLAPHQALSVMCAAA